MPLVCAVPLRGCGFEIIRKVNVEREVFGVSVPLRGCGFEIVRQSLCKLSVHWKVSVPLRGCGFEITKLFFERSNIMVSVPLRGCGFEIWICSMQSATRAECFRPLAGMWF